MSGGSCGAEVLLLQSWRVYLALRVCANVGAVVRAYNQPARPFRLHSLPHCRDAEGGDTVSKPGSRRRKRSSRIDMRTALFMLLIMSFMGSMLFFLTRVSSQHPLAPAPAP